MRATGGVYLGFILLEGESFRMETFGRPVFCEVRTQIVGKTIVFRQSYIGYFRNRPGAMPTLLRKLWMKFSSLL